MLQKYDISARAALLRTGMAELQTACIKSRVVYCGGLGMVCKRLEKILQQQHAKGSNLFVEQNGDV